MGGTTSKARSEIISNLAISAVQETVQNCVTNATQQQIIDVGYVGGNVDISGSTFKQAMSVDLSCVMNSKNSSEISAAIANVIVQNANAESEGLLVPPGGTEAEVITDLENNLSVALRQSDIQNSISNVSSEQRITFGYVGGNFIGKNMSFDQTASVIAKSIVSAEKVQSIIASVANDITQVAESKSKGADAVFADMIGNIFSGIGLMIMLPLIILVIVGAMIYFMTSGGSTSMASQGFRRFPGSSRFRRR